MEEGKPDRIRLRSRIKVFVFCLILSFFFWLLIGLSKDYEVSVLFPVRIDSIPQTLLYAGNPNQTITLYLQGKGFLLMRKFFLEKPQPLHLDISQFKMIHHGNKWTAIIPSRKLVQPIRTQLRQEVEIKSVLPDTLVLDFSRASRKTIPVEPILNLKFNEQYRLYGNYSLIPDKVTITGEENRLIPYTSLTTLPENIENIDRDMEVYLNLQKPPGIHSIDPESVLLRIPVEKFTETEVKVRLEVRDPGNREIKLYPDEVTIDFLVALKDYKKLDPGSLKAVVDFTPGAKKLKVRVESSPSFVKILRIYPEEVEFIILKR